MLGAANDNEDGANSNNFIFTIKYTKLHFLVVILSLRDNQKDQCVGINIRKKNENKSTTNEYRYFLESNFSGVERFLFLFSSNQDKVIKLKSIICQKALLRSITSSPNEKNLMTNPSIMI